MYIEIARLIVQILLTRPDILKRFQLFTSNTQNIVLDQAPKQRGYNGSHTSKTRQVKLTVSIVGYNRRINLVRLTDT